MGTTGAPCRSFARSLSLASSVVWALAVGMSLRSCWSTDWWRFQDSPTAALREGLWSTCWGPECVPASEYAGGCQSLLAVARAFSVSAVLFAGLALGCAALMTSWTDAVMLPGLFFGLLTVCCSVVPWSVYLGFLSQCVLSNVARGSGWSQAVALLPTSLVALLLQGMWFLWGRPLAPHGTPSEKSISLA